MVERATKWESWSGVLAATLESKPSNQKLQKVSRVLRELDPERWELEVRPLVEGAALGAQHSPTPASSPDHQLRVSAPWPEDLDPSRARSRSIVAWASTGPGATGAAAWRTFLTRLAAGSTLEAAGRGLEGADDMADRVAEESPLCFAAQDRLRPEHADALWLGLSMDSFRS